MNLNKIEQDLLKELQSTPQEWRTVPPARWACDGH